MKTATRVAALIGGASVLTAMLGVANAEEYLTMEKGTTFALPTGKMELLRVQPSAGEVVLTITTEGRIFWKGREVETDDQLRAAMIDTAKAMGVAVGGRRPCNP